MFPFFRPRNEKDFSDKLLGKPKKYRLSRNGVAVTVTGALLAYFLHDEDPDGLMPPAAGRVDLLAIISTRSRRLLVYYVVSYPETEDIAGRHEYIQVCENLEAVRVFLGAMHYFNRDRFALALLDQAARTLSGKPQPASVASAEAAGTTAPAPEATANPAAGGVAVESPAVLTVAASDTAADQGVPSPTDLPAPDAAEEAARSPDAAGAGHVSGV